MWVLVVCLLGLVWSSRDTVRETEQFFTLKDNNLDNLLAKHHKLVVAFLSGNCPYSKNLLDDLNRRHGEFNSYGNSEVHICKLDCLVLPAICDKYSIDHYPTVKLFFRGKPINYTGVMKVDNLSRWVSMKTEEPFLVHKAAEHFMSYQYQKEAYAVLFAARNSSEAKEFEILARESPDDIFGLAPMPEFAEKCNVTQPSLLLYKYQDRVQLLYTGPWRAARMAEFIQRYKTAWLTKFDDNAAEYIFTLKEPRLIFFYQGYGGPYAAMLEAISVEIRHEIKLVYHDLYNDEDKLANFLGISSAFMPGAIILSWSEGVLQKFKHDGPMTKEGLLTFVDKWKTGKARLYVKSEKPPEEKPEDVVKVLVGSTFKETVYGGNVHVLVFIYASWSAKCKSNLPIYELVGKYFKPEGKDPLKVLVTKIDAAVNDLSDSTYFSFPVLKLYRKNKFPITYSGRFTSPDIISFVEENIY